MMNTGHCFLLFSFLVLSLSSIAFGDSEVVNLTADNFEHLTQSSTGATTGDWLVKFYAPWCGHCKTMAQGYEETAVVLKEDGLVNVAEVDASKERNLASRFNVKGFPTVIFLKNGKVYQFKGKRTKENFVDFARGGYKDYEQDSKPVPEPFGPVGEITKAFSDAFENAQKDFKRGDYYSTSILTCAMPFMFVLVTVLLFMIPVEQERVPRRKVVKKSASVSEENVTKADKND